MRTSKPISTISYNSNEFLDHVLGQLLKNHTIQFYMYVNHHKERDEAKDHTHLYVEPNKLLDTMVLQDMLKELDPSHPDKPLGCRPFCNSESDDWLLYDLHDPAYLASKGQSREYRYSIDQVHTSDPDFLSEKYRHAYEGSEWAQRNWMLNKIKEDPENAFQLVMNGSVPLGLTSQIRALQQMYKDAILDRSGRKTHTPIEPQADIARSMDQYLDKVRDQHRQDLDREYEKAIEGVKEVAATRRKRSARVQPAHATKSTKAKAKDDDPVSGQMSITDIPWIRKEGNDGN